MRASILFCSILSLLACSGVVPAGTRGASGPSAVSVASGSEPELIAVLIDPEHSSEERCAAAREIGASGGAGALDALGWAWGFAGLPCSSQEVPHAMRSICGRDASAGSWCRTVGAVGDPLGPIVTHSDFVSQRGTHDLAVEAGARWVTVERTFAQGPVGEPVQHRRVRRITVGPVSEPDTEHAVRYAAGLAWAALSDELLAAGMPESARDAAERGNAELEPVVVGRPEDMPKDIQQVWRARARLAQPSTRLDASRELRRMLADRLERIERSRPAWRLR